MSRPVVVKVGGSLYDLPDLGDRLRAFLDSIAAPVLVFPGGGPAADVVREFDRVHRLGDEAAHWLALRACTLNAHLLARLLPDTPVTARIPASVPRAIVDAYAFARDDEGNPDHLSHCWEVTSDSMALCVAQRAGAATLVLLKSVDAPPRLDWLRAAAEGFVDPYFPTVLGRCEGMAVRVVNLRR